MIKSLLLFALFLFIWPAFGFAEVKIIELKHRSASELVEPIRELLDENEKVQAAGTTLVLVADGESLLAAEKLIVLLDRQLQQLIIRMKFSTQQQRVAEGLSSSVTIGTNPRISLSTSAGHRLSNSVSSIEQNLRVVEGSGGWLEVGKEIPYRQQWSAFTGDITGYSEKIGYKTVAAGFWVRPVQVLGDSVLLEIEPQINRLSRQGSQGPPQVRFSQLRSRLTIPMGQWFPIGGHLRQNDQLSNDIISWRSNNGVADQVFYLRIDPAVGFSP